MTALPPRCHRADPRSEVASSSPWWLAYCRVNQEIGISDRLTAADVPHLLPVAQYDRATPSGKKRSTVQPLFPGYIFLSAPVPDGLEIEVDDPAMPDEEFLARPVIDDPRCLRGVVSITPIPDVTTLVADLSRLMILIESGAPIGGESVPIAPGESVRVTSGPWEGFTGIMIREHGKDSVWIVVEAIGRMVEMSVEGWRIERVEGQ